MHQDDNPFAAMLSGNNQSADADSLGPQRRKQVVDARNGLHRRFPIPAILRTTLLLVVCVVSVIVIHRASRAWLIARLSENLAAHPRQVQLERLEMLAEFGDQAIPVILGTLAEKDRELGLAGYEILREMQNRWQTVGGDQALSSEHAMMDAIATLAPQCPPKRRQWLATLVNQTLLATVDQEGEAAKVCYQRAGRLLGTLNPSSEFGDEQRIPKIARQIFASLQSPQTETPRGLPDASEGIEASETFPRRLVPLPTRVSAAEFPPAAPFSDSGTAPRAQPTSKPDGSGETPIGGRSTNILRIVPQSPSPSSTDPDGNQSDLDSRSDIDSRSIAPRLNLGPQPLLGPVPQSINETPLAVYDTRSVISLLNTEDKNLQAHAVQELRRRKMSQTEIDLAFQLVSPDLQTRHALVETLKQRSNIDPRSWLFWLAEDPSRDVRMAAISVLGTMNDPKTNASLRDLLALERDTAVASRIRRILGLK